MTKGKISIKKLYNKDIESISKIWIESLPLNLKSIIGTFMIKNYLNIFFNNKNNLGNGIFVNNKLNGFILFGDDTKIINNLIFKNFNNIFYSILKNFFILNIFKLFNYIDVVLFLLLSKNYEKKIRKNSIELLIIAIKKNKKNFGFGTKLVKKTLYINKDYFKNFNKIFVKTLKSTPENVSFYKKNKFIKKFEIFKRIYLELKLD